MKKTTKLLCLLLSVSLILSCLPTMGIFAAIGANGSYCDFNSIPTRAVGATALDSSVFTGTGLAFADNTDGIAVETQASRTGLHLYSSASVGAALPTAVTSGKVKVTVNLYPMGCATKIYLASSMGSSLATSTKTQIAKFGSGIFVGTSATSTAMTWAKWNRVELIIDLDKKTLDGYLNGTHLEQRTGVDISAAAGVIVGDNATLQNNVSNKPLIGDLGISTYTEDNTFSYVSSKDSVTDNVHTTTVMFDEPVKASTLAASAVTITPCTGGASIHATSASAYGPAVTLTWTGAMSVGTEYRIDFGSAFRSTYNRPLDDAAYLIKTASTSTKTLIDEDFDDLSVQILDVSGMTNTTGIKELGGESLEVPYDVAQSVTDADALCFNKSNDGTYDEPRYLKMPHSDAAYPYSTYTAPDGNYAAVPYQACSKDYSFGTHYRLGDLTKTELDGMPDSGIITWSFDYLWEQGAPVKDVNNVSLTWSGEGRDKYGTNLIGIAQNKNGTNEWKSIVVEYNASEKMVRWGTSAATLGDWTAMDMSTCDWLVIPLDTSVQRLSFAVDNVKVTWTQNPLCIEGIRYVARDGSVTGAPSIQAETDKINIYFSAAVTSDIASHITINGVAVSDYTLSSDGKMLTVNTGLFKAGSTVTLAIDARAASAAGNIIDAAKTYTLTTGAGRFALENFNAEVTAETKGTISTGDKVNVKADIINTSGEYDSCILICAYYTDNGNTLVDAGFYTVDLTAKYSAQVDHDFTPTAVGKAYDTVKVFAWDSLTGAIPLVDNLTK